MEKHEPTFEHGGRKTEWFSTIYIENQLKSLFTENLKDEGELTDLKLSGDEDTLLLNASMVIKKSIFSDIDVSISAYVNNVDDGLGLQKGKYAIKASRKEADMNGLLESKMRDIFNSLKLTLGQEKKKAVGRLWIENGRVNVQYLEEELKSTPETEEELLSKFGPTVEPDAESSSEDPKEEVTEKTIMEELGFEEKNTEKNDEVATETEVKVEPETEKVVSSDFFAESPDNNVEETLKEKSASAEKLGSQQDFHPGFINDLILEEVAGDLNGFTVKKVQRYTKSEDISFKILLTDPQGDNEVTLTMVIQNSENKGSLQAEFISDNESAKQAFLGFNLKIEKKLAEKTGSPLLKTWFENGRIHVLHIDESFTSTEDSSETSSDEILTENEEVDVAAVGPESKLSPEEILSPEVQAIVIKKAQELAMRLYK